MCFAVADGFTPQQASIVYLDIGNDTFTVQGQTVTKTDSRQWRERTFNVSGNLICIEPDAGDEYIHRIIVSKSVSGPTPEPTYTAQPTSTLRPTATFTPRPTWTPTQFPTPVPPATPCVETRLWMLETKVAELDRRVQTLEAR